MRVATVTRWTRLQDFHRKKKNKSQLVKKEPPHCNSPIDGINARVALSFRQEELSFGL